MNNLAFRTHGTGFNKHQNSNKIETTQQKSNEKKKNKQNKNVEVLENKQKPMHKMKTPFIQHSDGCKKQQFIEYALKYY